MIGLTFRSEDMPAEDRFDHWRALLDRSRASEVDSAYARDYRAECRLMELGPVTVLPLACAPARYRRGTRTVRATDPERYHLTLLLDGDATLDHAGRSGALRPGDLHVVDSSRPYDLRMADDGGRLVRGIGVDFPKALLPLPPHRMGELLGRGLPVQDGMGALLTQMLAGLERQADTLRPADAPRLGAVVLDLLSAWLAQLAEAEAALAPETRHRVMAERVLAFIKQNLHDPELSPPVIAAAHHISLSYLHRVFRQWSQGSRSRRGSAGGGSKARAGTWPTPCCGAPRSTPSRHAGGCPGPRTSPGPSAPPTASVRRSSAARRCRSRSVHALPTRCELIAKDGRRSPGHSRSGTGRAT